MPFDALRRAVHVKGQLHARQGSKPVEDVAVTQVRVIGIRRAAHLVARRRIGGGARRVEHVDVHDAFGLGDGCAPQKDGVNGAVRSGRSTHPERQRDDDDRGEARLADKRSEGVAKIALKSGEHGSSQGAGRLVQMSAPGVSGAVRGRPGGGAESRRELVHRFWQRRRGPRQRSGSVEAEGETLAIDVVEMLCQLLDDLLLSHDLERRKALAHVAPEVHGLTCPAQDRRPSATR